MSKATKRKIVRQEVCDPESWQPPGPGRALARVLAGRGNNLHEVMVAGEIPPTRTRSSSPHVGIGKMEEKACLSPSSLELQVEVHDQEVGCSMPTDCLSKASIETVASSQSTGKVQVSSKTEDWPEKRILASMPRKFRRSVWVRRGDVVVIEWIPEGDKVKAEIVSVVLRKMVRALRAAGELEWPPEFDHPDFGDIEKSHNESASGDENDEDDDDLPQNTNRRPLPVVSDSSSSTSSTTSTTSSSSDDEESDSEDEGGGEGAGSVFENPNRRTVSRSLSKSDSSTSDEEEVRGKGDVILNLKK